MRLFGNFLGLMLLVLNCHHSAVGQRKFTHVTLETGNAASSFPLLGVPEIFAKYHPYSAMGLRMSWKEKKRHAWEQSIKLVYLYHRFVHHNIPLYTATSYRYDLGKNFNLRAQLGIGYLHSIPATERFELNAQGEYIKIRSLGRAQGMVQFSLGAGYEINNQYELHLNYGVIGQMPFVKSYVPLLPYNTLQAGVAKRIRKK
jgi:hypothetical protein